MAQASSSPKQSRASQHGDTSARTLIAALIVAFFLIALIFVLQAFLPEGVAEGDLFRSISVVVVALIVSVLLFGLIAGATASFSLKTGRWALTMGGAAAGFAGFFWIISERLTPVRTMTILVQDSSGQSWPDKFELVADQSIARQTITVHGGRGRFDMLARGAEVTLRPSDSSFRILDISGSECSVTKHGELYNVGPRCAYAQITIGLRPEAQFQHIRYFEAEINYGAGYQASLGAELNQITSSVQRWALLRNSGVVVNLFVSEIDPGWLRRPFKLDTGSLGRAQLCVILSVITRAYNEEYPNQKVSVFIAERELRLQSGEEIPHGYQRCT